MDGASVFQKTPLGEQELQDRTLKLDFKMRSILILIDGKKTSNQVIQTVKHLGLGLEAFQSLQDLGLVEASKTSASAAPTERTPVERYMDGQRYMTGIARDALGIKGLFFKLKIERCSNVDELNALLNEFEQMISKKLGPDQAGMARKTAENIMAA